MRYSCELNKFYGADITGKYPYKAEYPLRVGTKFMAKKRKNNPLTTQNKSEFVFKVIGAIGIIAGIIFGVMKLSPEEAPTFTTYNYDAELVSTPREIVQTNTFKLVQFEIDGISSGYISRQGGFAGIRENGKEYKTYVLDPYYYQTSKSSSSNPVFNVTIQNSSDNQLILTEIIYRVHRVGQVKGGDFGPLAPNVKYRHRIQWKVGDQVAKFVPPFSVSPKRAGSFLLEVASITEGIGMAWLLDIVFVNSNGKSVSTGTFQLIMGN